MMGDECLNVEGLSSLEDARQSWRLLANCGTGGHKLAPDSLASLKGEPAVLES